jgi:hypothetical protein
MSKYYDDLERRLEELRLVSEDYAFAHDTGLREAANIQAEVILNRFSSNKDLGDHNA